MSARGEKHYLWKGDDADTTTKRSRLQRMLSLEGVVCEHDGCEKPAVDRHHLDDDTGNNDLSNIRCLCRYHHMEEDGRLAAFAALRPAKQSPKPCANCGEPSKPLRRGRCKRCADYFWRRGCERPEHLWARRGVAA